MFYLPRICEHCLNPSCVASCPSGAMYKREEDGIVLVDQDKCRGWRFCVSGCPYKKVYFNHRSGKAEKCTLCYPRIEQGQPTICSETCVGRIRYLGLVLYDADRVEAAASVPDERDLLDAQMGVFLDPDDPEVQAPARADGIPEDWLEAARRSPVYTLAVRYRLALPLHPEYRTLPMVWYVPPLSPVVNALETDGYEADPDDIFPAIDTLRIPLEYLANLLVRRRRRGDPRRPAATGGDARLHAQAAGDAARSTSRCRPRSGSTPTDLETMYRLLAIAKYDERYVIPKAHGELAARADGAAGRLRPRLRGRPGQLRRRPQPAARATGASCSRRACRSSARNERMRSRRAGRPAVQAALRPAPLPGRAARRRATRRSPPRSPRCRAAEERSRSPRFAEHLAGAHAALARPAPTSRRSTCTGARASTSPTTCTATRASAAWRCCGSNASTPPAASSTASGELPDYLPLMLEFAALAPDGVGERCCASTGRRSSCSAAASTTRRARTRTCSTRSAPACRGSAPVERERVRRLAADGPPSEQVGLAAVRAARGDARRGARMSHRASLFVWLVLPYVSVDDLRGRALVALPPRPVRLDEPLDPAAREPPARLGQPALPLRRARGDRRPRARHPRPGERAPTPSASRENAYHHVAGDRRRHRRARLPRRLRRSSSSAARGPPRPRPPPRSRT